MIAKNKRNIIDKKIFSSIKNLHEGTFLYVNYPFCLNHCQFCIYKICRYNKKDSDLFTRYLRKEISLYSKILNQKHFKFKNIHFGGGTPNLISPEALIKPLRSLIDFNNIKHFVIEAFPRNNLSNYR